MTLSGSLSQGMIRWSGDQTSASNAREINCSLCTNKNKFTGAGYVTILSHQVIHSNCFKKNGKNFIFKKKMKNKIIILAFSFTSPPLKAGLTWSPE